MLLVVGLHQKEIDQSLLDGRLDILIKELELTPKLYALFVFPKRSAVNVAPFTVPLFPFPLASFALPQKGQ